MLLGNAPALAAQSPPLLSGLWVTQKMPANDFELSSFAKAVAANPNLTGICLHIGWKDIEKQSGKLDFSAIDKTVEVLRQIGRKYELSVKPGAETPAYVYEEGAKPFLTRANNPHRPNFGQKLTIPVPWDPVYQRNFSRVIEELGRRYAADPLCVSVVLTCANFQSAEMHLPQTPEDRAKWKGMGNYEEKLLQVYKKYTDEWAKAFPKQAISLHLSKVLDLPPSFNERIIEYGLSKYPERFTIQNDQLTGRKEDIAVMAYSLVQKYRDRARHGFQSAGAFVHGGERMGSMEMAALNMVHAKGEYWELWHDDGLSVEVSENVSATWKEAIDLGYDAYKKMLISKGKYRDRGEDGYAEKVRRRRKAAQTEAE